MDDGKTLSAGYREAGSDFLATRLDGMFRQLKTPEDVALHNLLQREVMLMVGDEPVMFLQSITHTLLRKRAQKKKRRKFRRIVAESILGVAKG